MCELRKHAKVRNMPDKPQLIRNDLLYPELCYQINGALFDVYRQLGGGHDEKTYQKATAQAFYLKKIIFSEQFYMPIKFNDKIVGKYYLDFLVENKIIIELKRGKFIPMPIIRQTERYLEALNLPLALIACFTYNGVTVKRIINRKLVPKTQNRITH